MTPTKVFSFEYCQIFNITCFEEHLQKAASIKCYFGTINLKQCGFCTTYYIKILVSERKYKNNLKNREPQKKKFFSYIDIYIYNALQWNLVVFPRFWKWKSVFFLYLYSILNLSLEIMLSPSKWGTKHLYNS